METLAELREQIRFWSERRDISDSQLDHFVNLVEQDYKDTIHVPTNEKIVVHTTDANGQIPVPYDYLKAKHLHTTTNTGAVKPIFRKPNELVSVLGSFSAENGTSYFERKGNMFQFAPNPGEGAEVEITYYALIPSLLDAEAADPDYTNFVLVVMPTVYLFGSLMFLHMYTYNEERASYYKTLYEEAKDALVNMQAEAEMSGSSLHVVPTLSDSGRTW